MAGFTAYVPAGAGGAALERTVLVPDRFRWSAFLFAPLWLLAKRLWWPLGAYLGACLIAVALVWAFPVLRPLAGLAALALNLLVALEAPRLDGMSLERRGFVSAGPVEAPDAEGAEARFFERALAALPPDAPRAPLSPLAPASGARDGAPGIVGLFPSREAP